MKVYKLVLLLAIVLFGFSSCIYQSYRDGYAGTDADEIGDALAVLRGGIGIMIGFSSQAFRNYRRIMR